LNIECGFHIYNYMQELKKITRLVEGKVDQWLSNEVRFVALALGISYALVVGTSYFVLLNGLILELYNFYFVPIF